MQITVNSKAARHWPLWGESTGGRWISLTGGSNLITKAPPYWAVHSPHQGPVILNRFHIMTSTLQWRHNERDGVSNLRRFDCLLNSLFRRRSQKTSKLVTGLCEGNSRVSGEFTLKGPVTRNKFPFGDVIMEENTWWTAIVFFITVFTCMISSMCQPYTTCALKIIDYFWMFKMHYLFWLHIHVDDCWFVSLSINQPEFSRVWQ